MYAERSFVASAVAILLLLTRLPVVLPITHKTASELRQGWSPGHYASVAEAPEKVEFRRADGVFAELGETRRDVGVIRVDGKRVLKRNDFVIYSVATGVVVVASVAPKMYRLFKSSFRK